MKPKLRVVKKHPAIAHVKDGHFRFQGNFVHGSLLASPVGQRQFIGFAKAARKKSNVQQAIQVRIHRTMGIISAIIIGLIVGAIARFLMPGKDPGGWIITILIGLAGSFIGTYLGQAVGLYRTGEPAGIIGSIVGAMILLLLYRLVVKRRT
jgi:uncharacterized membrane protein YeaQ/YmgE (transglycosylase-associated protein family)